MVRKSQSITPYAVLLVRPSDNDDAVRKAFHALAERWHPDKRGGEVTGQWHAAAQAYAVVKTEGLRAAWERSMKLHAGRCAECEGYGVKGSRLTKVRVCSGCGGGGKAAGRTRK